MILFGRGRCYDPAVCRSYDGGETWLDSSMGRASARYAVGPRFDSSSSHFFFSVLLSYHLAGQTPGVSHLHLSQAVCIYSRTWLDHHCYRSFSLLLLYTCTCVYVFAHNLYSR